MVKKNRDLEETFEIGNNNKVSFSIPEVIVVIIISILFGGIIGSSITLSRTNKSNGKSSSELSDFVVAYNNIVSDYYNKVDKEKLINSAIEGMINSLEDPYSTFMDSKASEDFNTTVSGQYKGIGATISLIDDQVTVVGIFKDSPAYDAGLKVGDIILLVNDKDVKGMDLDKVVSLIKKRDKAKLSITRGEEKKEIIININDVQIPSVGSEIIERDGNKVGVVSISVFAANTYEQFKKELDNLEKKSIDSLVIDVRDNPGGHLEQVTKVLSLFMNKKKVLYQVKENKKKTKFYSLNNDERKYKIAVLINSSSASASEILTAAMKESYGAVIVGKKSYGKGTVQKEYSLSNGASIKYTTEEWLTPKGKSINGKGIEPDIDVDLDEKYYDSYARDDDNQLQTAINKLLEN
ncbi:MAG: S41 family peptidase [Bacilli bacterium]|nr:S41 family peptidase [Bacilli bacterium]